MLLLQLLISLQFQSTLPARGATDGEFVEIKGIPISIHAPREGSDLTEIVAVVLTYYFNPRSPRGERRPLVLWQVYCL